MKPHNSVLSTHSLWATHFIAPDPIRRTEKFFAATVAGKRILKIDYLTASSQTGKFLIEEPCEWHKNGFSEDDTLPNNSHGSYL